jgi:LacI family transcriptional regulator
VLVAHEDEDVGSVHVASAVRPILARALGRRTQYRARHSRVIRLPPEGASGGVKPTYDAAMAKRGAARPRNIGATIRDVAKRAQVTDTTVSLTFQPESRISDATRKRVMRAAQELGYVPNFAARQLRRGATRIRMLGLLVTDIVNPFYPMMAEAAERAAELRGYRVALANSQWSAGRELAAIDGMIQSRLDGVLACFVEGATTAEAIARLDRSAIPALVLDTSPPGYRGAAVLNDLDQAGRIAARHLAEIGCRRPTLLSAEAERAPFSAFRALIAGFRAELHERGVSFDDARVIPAGMSISAGIAAFPRLGDADGVFCLNASCALGVMEAADRAGVVVGRQLPVVAMDDLEVCGLGRISLTAVRQPYQRMAEVAVEALIDAIEKGATPSSRTMLPAELVVRRSTAR